MLDHLVCANISGTTRHVGATTDGRNWSFYYFDRDMFFLRQMVADTDENTAQILGTSSLSDIP